MRKVIAILCMVLICTAFVLMMRYDVTKPPKEVELPVTEVEDADIEARLLAVKETAENDYPGIPKEVIELINEIMACQYNEAIEKDDLATAVTVMRLFYSEDLLKLNDYLEQLGSLSEEVAENKDQNLFIKDYAIDSIEFKQENMAYVIVSYTTTKGDLIRAYDVIKEDGRWKVHNWKDLIVQS